MPATAPKTGAPIAANYFLLFASWAVLSPYLQLYLKARGLAESRIGLLLGLLEIAGVAGPLVIGRLADRLHTYRALLAACFLIPVAVLASMETTTRFPAYVAAMLAIGFTYRAVIPLLDSIVSRLLTDPVRQYGRLRVAGGFGFVALSVVLQIGGWVTGEASRPILIAFGLTACGAAAAVKLLPPVPDLKVHRQSRTTQQPGSGFDAAFWAVIGVIFLGRFGIGAYYSFFSLYLKQTFPGSGVSLLWAIGPFAEFVTIWYSGAMIRRWGMRAMFMVSLAAVTVRLLLFVVAPNLTVVALAQLLHAFTFGTFHTTAVAFINAKINLARRGTGMAVYNAVGIGLATFLASAAGGWMIETRGFVALFVAYAAVPVIGILALLGLRRAFVFGPPATPPETGQ